MCPVLGTYRGICVHVFCFVVKDQQVGPFCSSFVYVAIKKKFNSVGRIKSMDSSSTKDMNSPAISGDMLAV